MSLDIDNTLTPAEIRQLALLASHQSYDIYHGEDHFEILIAVNKKNLIIGCFEFAENDDSYTLAHMNVSPSHKYQGIGKNILREAVKKWGQFELPAMSSHEGTYYYVEDGLRFIRSCFPLILNPLKFKRP